MASSPSKVPTIERVSSSVALKRLIDAECEKYKGDEKSAIDGRFFIPRRHVQREYVLGPIFKEIPSELPALYPRLENQCLLYEGGLDWQGWKVNRPHRCWPTMRPEWQEWYDRVVPARTLDLQELCLLDALRLSRVTIPEDPFLIPAALCFWNPIFNFFQFRCGMMAPTVLDICHLLGVSPIGTPITPDFPDLVVPFSLPSLNVSYSDFVRVENKRMGPVTDREFFSFLLYWLCKFLFCTSSQRIMLEFAPLAKALVLQKRIALAPYILGHVYRVCSLFCEKPLDANQGGPFWILQLWLFAYFSELQSKCLKFSGLHSLTHGIKLANASLYPATFAFYFSFFHQLPAALPDHRFRPFEASIGPTWLNHFLSDRLCALPIHKDMWASLLIPRELFIGTTNPRAYKCIAEPYCPTQFARQFGLTQGVPIPLCSNTNLSLTKRDLKVRKSRLEEATFKFMDDLASFEFIPFSPHGPALKRYQNWWVSNMEVYLAISSQNLLEVLDVPKPKEAETVISSTIPITVTATTQFTSAASIPPRVTRSMYPFLLFSNLFI